MIWNIISLDSKPSTGIVVSAIWKCSEGNISRTGQSVFPEPSQDIIPYQSLSEQDVLNWVWSDGGVDKSLVEDSINKEISDLENPVVVKNPLPWNK